MLIALLLGIVEGITEFLPISSTGHLILVGNAVGFTGDRAASFEVFIQLGAILAVVWLYFDRLKGLSKWQQTDGFHGRNGLRLLALTTLPALVVGSLFHGYIKSQLFNPLTVAIGLAIGGIAILVIESKKLLVTTRNLDNITSRQAIGIGLVQVVALFPGISRSAATILGGMGAGLNRETAVQYSFLAAVPVMIAAISYDLVKSLPYLQSSDIGFFAVGFVSAFVTALVAIKFLLRFVKTSDFKPFGWYRIVLSVLVLTVLAVV